MEMGVLTITYLHGIMPSSPQFNLWTHLVLDTYGTNHSAGKRDQGNAAARPPNQLYYESNRKICNFQ